MKVSAPKVRENFGLLTVFIEKILDTMKGALLAKKGGTKLTFLRVRGQFPPLAPLNQSLSNASFEGPHIKIGRVVIT